jgi:chaperonin cofactor prefoldin
LIFKLFNSTTISDLVCFSLVINAIQNLNKDRKCYRLVGGVLVERTVGEVLSAVQKNRDNVIQHSFFGRVFCPRIT